MLDLRQLQAFVAVVEHGSFTRAAERLHIGQSGLSAQVKKLERRLGYELFDRSGRQVETTGAGRKLYGAAQQVLAAAERFDRLAGTATTSPVLRLAIAENGVNALAVDLLSRLRGSLVETDLELQRVSLLEQHDAAMGDFDGVIARPPYAAEPHAATSEILLAHDPLMAVVHEESPFVDASSISVDEVGQLDLIALPWIPRSWSERYPVFRRAEGADGDHAGTVGSFREAIASVSINRTSCVMPASFASTYNLADVAAVPIDGIEPMRVVLLTGPATGDSMTAKLTETLGETSPVTLPLAPVSS